ncbi:MAG: undecaprenyl/decaprenyl-phosphate alpha-N-acetylglucosaminyl 1-phosphate transferase, partial [Fervidobacterium sp.]|nr:undecaprenyl/decaprenyl-phosphate alpha-N-acetylglucosaminyl 1-phosphate transferase [Fervidobacterium sp.]
MFFILIPILLVLLLRALSIRTNILLEYPDERKQHNHPVPLLGGLVLFISTIIFSALGLIENKLTCDICFYLVFIIGVLDDLFELRYYMKLIMQILVSILYVQSNVIAITNNNAINIVATALWFVVILNA